MVTGDTQAAGLPHTRSSAAHWAVTAVALAAVVCGGVLLRPSEVSANPAPRRSSAPPKAPAASSVRYPTDCRGGAAPVVAGHLSADLTGDGRPETVAAVHCEANGSPPYGIYVLTTGRSGPRILATLLDPEKAMTAGHLSITGRTVSAKLLGYSSDTVPRCCPDLRLTWRWHWNGTRFTLVKSALSANT